MSSTRFIGVFLLAMLNLSAMDSLRGLPIIAEYGWQSLFYYLLVALIFVLPAALVSAELATGWPKAGGVYVWVKEAFGQKWGFFAVWIQWIHNTTWFPAVLAFIGAATAYLFDPALAESKLFLFFCILIGFWAVTLLNYFGLKASTWFSTLSVIAGTIVPGLLLIALAVHWMAIGQPIYTPFSLDALIPRIHGMNDLVLLAGMVLSFGGLELSAAHAEEVKNPQRNFPKAILIATVLALFLYVAGALSIAIMLPREQISLVAGLMEAFSLFFDHSHMAWLIIPVGLLIVLGALAELNSWIVGPARALHATAKDGNLPHYFNQVNKHGMPTRFLFSQAILVSIVALIFLCMPTASSGFWILSAISVQLYLLMYILLFLAAIRLRYTHPRVVRDYRIPGGKMGIWLVGSIGTLTAIFTYGLGFLPPAQIHVGNLWFYDGFLLLGNLVMCALPFLIYRYQHSKKTYSISKNE